MPTSIYEYVEHHFPSAWSESTLNAKRECLSAMIAKMLSTPPTFLDTQTSEYFSPTYSLSLKDIEKTRLMNWIIEKIFYPISVTSSNVTAKTAFWGNLPTMEEQAKRMFLVEHALRFSLTGLGNCSTRSSYAAIQLFNILENSGLEIELRSFIEIDHFVLCIKNSQNEYKIYDPLTNPELIFDENEYNQKIKSLFNPVTVQKRPFDLLVDERVSRQYIFHGTKIGKYLERECQHVTIDSLKIDLNYSAFLVSKNISDPDYRKTSEAYEQLCNLLNWKPAPKIGL